MAYLDSTGLATQTQYIKAYVNSRIANQAATGTAAKATADADGNVITTTYATKAEVNTAASNAVSNLVNSAPATLDTLSELASALGNDPNFATTITTQLGNKLNASSANYIKSAAVDNDILTLTKGDDTTITFQGGGLTSVNWSDINDPPATYAPSTHNQASNTINAMTGYSKPSSTSAIAASDTLNAAIGKIEKALDDKQASGNYAGSSSAGGAANSATKLATARAIDGVSFDGSAAIIHYGTCSTAAATAAKTVACTSFTLVTGSRIIVKFTVTNTVDNPTLNVNSTGAKAIQYRGAAIAKGYLAANRTYEFVYDGTNYQLVGDIDTNTTYSAGTTALLVTGSDTANRVWPVKQLVDYIKPRSVEFIKGTQTAATGSFTGVTTDAALYDGKTIRYYLPYAGSGNATLNLTLSGGGTTGAKVICWSGTTQLTTHYGAGSVMTLTYVASDDKWHGADYNTNTTNSAGAGNSTAKLFLVGTTAQSTGTSYSNANVYATNGALYATSISTGGNVVVGGTANTNYLQLPSGIKLY